MRRRVFLAGAVAAAAPVSSFAGSDEMLVIDGLYDAWSAAALQVEHAAELADEPERNEEFEKAWEDANEAESEALLRLLSHEDQSIEGLRMRCRYINIAMQRDKLYRDYGSLGDSFEIFLKSLV